MTNPRRLFVRLKAYSQKSVGEAAEPRLSSDKDQAYRAISTGKLQALLLFHIRPINVMVYHGSQGILVLRQVSRLDAFSVYLFRT